MRAIGFSLIGLIVLSGAAFGQDGERGGRRGGGDRGGWDRGGRGGWDRGARTDRFLDQLRDEVGFDDAQLASAREILTANQGDTEDGRARWEEMREAMQNGDRELAGELREHMMAQRGEREAAMETALDEIGATLTDDQASDFTTFREGMNRRRDEGRRRGEMYRAVYTLPETLNMSDDQRDEFRGIIAERRESMRQRWQDRAAAEESAESDGQPRDRSRGRPEMGFFDEEFFTAVDELLDDGQREQFAQIRAEFEGGARSPGADRRRDARREPDLRTMLEASRRVPDLTSDQRGELKQISGEAMRAFRELRGDSDKEGMALLTSQTKAEIEKVLTDEQAEVFNARLSRERGDRHRADRPRRSRDGDAKKDGRQREPSAAPDDGETDEPKKGKGKRRP